MLKTNNPENPKIPKILILTNSCADNQPLACPEKPTILTYTLQLTETSYPENPKILKILILTN